MRGTRLWIAGATVLGLIAAGALVLRRAGGPARQPAETVSSTPPPPPEISLPGKIRAQNIVPVAATVEGQVEQFMADVGEEVFEGQLLARIKNTGLEAAHQAAMADFRSAEEKLRALESGLIAARLEVSRAQADSSRARSDFDRAQQTFARQQMLYREGATPRLTFEKAQKEFEMARLETDSADALARQAESRLASLQKELEKARAALDQKSQALEEARQNLAAAEILSPVDGLVVARSKQAGDTVSPDVHDLFQIAVDLSFLEVVLEPDPPTLERLRPGQPALVEVAEGPVGGMAGRVKEIKSGQVIVEFSNASPAVKPGLTAQVRIKVT